MCRPRQDITIHNLM